MRSDISEVKNNELEIITTESIPTEAYRRKDWKTNQDLRTLGQQ